MAELHTRFIGLDLRNPLIVSSSGLSDSVEKIQQLAQAGAGAVVLKSLFEEQILFEAGSLSAHSDYPEADDYLINYTRSNSVDKYLDLIELAARTADIPVIASINCVSDAEWTDFAAKVEEAGAAALELNVYFLPSNQAADTQAYEQLYLDIAEKVKTEIEIPVIMKLGPNFTNLVGLVEQLYHRGIEAVVLFNRFYSPDINIDTMKMTSAEVFSSPADIRHSLRWVAIVSAMVEQIELVAGTGVHDGAAMAKQILAGATAVQVCSAIYRHGPEHIPVMLEELSAWMDRSGFKNPGDFRGSMNYGNIPDPAVYERSQFMRYFSSHH